MNPDRAMPARGLPALDLLWPGGGRRLSRRPGGAPALLVLPARRAPRMLVPTGVPGAETMLWRHSRSRRQRLAQQALARGVRSGLLSWLPLWRLAPGPGGPDGAAIEDHVRTHLPDAASVGVLLGPPRANAKPVLRVFDHAGRTIAFGKVGHAPLSAALVRREAEVLRELGRAPFSTLELPTVLHAGRWQGLEVLLMTALDTPRRGAPSWDLPLDAMYELADRDRREPGTVDGSSYLRGLSERVAALPRTGAGPAVVAMLEHASARTGGTEVAFGRWHGDWAPWNMASRSARVGLWDWERSTVDVPLGFDVVHFALQGLLSRGGPSPVDAPRLLDLTRVPLRRWCRSREQVEATVALYLVEIVVRYTADAGDQPSAALRNRLSRITGIFSQIADHRPEESYADA